MTTKRKREEAGNARIDERAALARVVELMSIPGGSGRERAAAEWVRRQLLAAGARRSWISMDSAQRRSPHLNGGGDCGNLILKMPGTFKAPRRMLMAHIDTVPLCEGARPVFRGGRMVPEKKTTALGADDRAGCAAILTAALEILARRLPHPPLTFLWTVQEEVGLFGARFCSTGKLGNPGLVFNWDGYSPARLTVGATGAYNMDIVIHGVASHAGLNPEAGVSAAAIFGLAMADLRKRGWHGLIEKNGARGSGNVGVVEGGDATNVVMDRLKVRAEARAHNRKLRKRIVAAYRAAFERAAGSVKSSRGKRGWVSFKATLTYESFKLPESAPCILDAERVARSMGFKPRREIGNGGLDANWMIARGLQAVTLGAGARDAHKAGESLVTREYLAACRMALLLAGCDCRGRGARPGPARRSLLS